MPLSFSGIFYPGCHRRMFTRLRPAYSPWLILARPRWRGPSPPGPFAVARLRRGLFAVARFRPACSPWPVVAWPFRRGPCPPGLFASSVRHGPSSVRPIAVALPAPGHLTVALPETTCFLIYRFENSANIPFKNGSPSKQFSNSLTG